jgi:hypothetical protein
VQQWGAGVAQFEGAHTTHMTAADAFGNVVATTQTINNLFGAKFLIPGLGTVPNNHMNLYDPRPGHALSLAPGKRVTTSMSPVMALRDGKLVYALALPGGKKIFPSALRRHERHPVPRGRLAHGRGLLARRRHADRPCRRAGACRGSIWAGVIGCVIPDERSLNPQDSGRLPVGTPVVLPVNYCTNLHG